MINNVVYDHPSWDRWYGECHILELHRARCMAHEMGVNRQTILSELYAQSSHTSAGMPQHDFLKKHFQSCALSQILAAETYNHEHFVRMRLARWQISVAPGILARRACKTLTRIFELVAPKVGIVVFRTWLNGWCTGFNYTDGTAGHLTTRQRPHFVLDQTGRATHLTTGVNRPGDGAMGHTWTMAAKLT